MTRQRMGLFDGFTDADRNQVLYEFFWAASEVGGHFPPVRSFARILFRRRQLQVFTSHAGADTASVLLLDPKLAAGGRRPRGWPGGRR